MKKTLSVILATLILALSVFSVNVFAAESTKTEDLLDKINETKEFAITLAAGDIPLFGSSSDASDIIYVKDDKIAYEYKAGFINVRVVLDDDEVFAFIPAFPFVHVKMDMAAIGSLDIGGLIEEATSITKGVLAYVDTYEEELDGVKYTVEEFNDRAEVTTKLYYDADGQLKIINVVDERTNSVQNTYIKDLSLEVDDGIFELPLISFDLTPLLQGLFLSILASGLI